MKIIVFLIIVFAYFLQKYDTQLVISANIDEQFDLDANNGGSSEDVDFHVQNLSKDFSGRVLETMYARSSPVGKSHRFYFTLGERQDGDGFITQTAKQMGWKSETNTTVTIQYPGGDKKDGKKLTYVLVIAYQGSLENRIHVVDGGINSTFINISVQANQTKYLQYNATFYGL